MHDFILLRDIVIILAAVILIIPLFQRFRIPTILGFILAGVIIGPHGTGLIGDITDVQVLAEIGIVLLLFSIGMELSLERILGQWKNVVVGGGLQLLVTASIITGLTLMYDFKIQEALFVGFLVSLSSTAIVLKLFYDRGETHTPHGKIAIGILLFQDLAFVPLMLLVPMLGAAGALTLWPVALRLLTAILTIGGIIFAARYIFPWFIHYAIKARSRELFVLVVVVLSFGTAWISSALGLSLALGAFVAGLGLSQSEYSHQIAAETAPLRNILGSLFFISLGMLLNPGHVAENPVMIAGAAIVVQLLKVAVIIPVVLFLRTSLRVAIISGFALAQVGEFSFLLAQTGQDAGLMGAGFYQTFYAVTLISMLMTPLMLYLAPLLAERFQKRAPGADAPEEGGGGYGHRVFRDHVIIVGYGLNGKNVSSVLRETGIPYIVAELDIALYRAAVAEGHPALYGDCTQEMILSDLGISRARALVVAISDPVATRMIVRTSRILNESMFLIARTRYVSEIGDLTRMGANEVIPEEFETSIEIFTRVLREFHIPKNVITAQVELLRMEGYGLMRGLKMPEATLDHIESILAAGTTDTFLVLHGSPSIGKSLLELDIRKRSGASIIAIVRDSKPIFNPPPDVQLAEGDILVLIGTHRDVESAFNVLEGRAENPS